SILVLLMSEKSVVSVIIPSYNRIRYIEEAISSIESQSYQDYEIIIVDDGSTDGSLALLEDFSKKGRIKLYTHADYQNRGQSSSINLGLEHAVGEFIAVLDS